MRKKSELVDWQRLERIALQQFGVKKLRSAQREIIEFALSGKNVLGILPTGAGKSLCFQLPSMVLDGNVIVVSPLIALMKDQTDQMEELGVNAAEVNSTLTVAEELAVVDAVAGKETKLIYVTPERLENPEFVELLKKSKTSLFVVDEAHCVSQWGHDFRPAYLNLRTLITTLGNPPVMALTATASDEVAEDIVNQLALKSVEVVNDGIERRNLQFLVKNTVNEQIKKDTLVELLREHNGCGLVYVATVKSAEELSTWLDEQKIPSARYHGKMRIKDRESVQQSFMNDDFKVIVATKAFGLGINKPNVRFVIHYHFPDSIESYYQEAGRAGRDGAPAIAMLLYQLEDKRIQSFFLGGKYPSREESRRLYDLLGTESQTLTALADKTGLAQKKLRVLVAYLEGAEIISRKKGIRKAREFEDAAELEKFLDAYEGRHSDDRARLEKMMHYAQSTQCRVQIIREYFGYEEGNVCGNCDNCDVGKLHA